MPSTFHNSRRRYPPHLYQQRHHLPEYLKAAAMGDKTSTITTTQQLFCCAQCPLERKANIPPNHPLHQLLDYLSTHLNGNDITLPSAATVDAPQASSPGSAETPQSIPDSNECAIIIISDPNISEPSQPPTFDPSRVTSTMYWGTARPKSSSTISSPTSATLNSSTQAWGWKEKVDARNNVGGILKEVEGNMEGRLNKQMTGFECREHGWKYTFVVLIGVTPKTPQQLAHERLLEMAAQAGAKDGSAEGAPSCNPQ